MVTQVNIKTTGPWRSIVRQDNQDARVVNADEEFSIILNESPATTVISITEFSTVNPIVQPVGEVQKEPYAPDPHEPDKSAEDRNIAHDPLERQRELMERNQQNRPFPGSPVEDKLMHDQSEISRVGLDPSPITGLGGPSVNPASGDHLPDDPSFGEENAANEASRKTGEETARKKEEERSKNQAKQDAKDSKKK